MTRLAEVETVTYIDVYDSSGSNLLGDIEVHTSPTGVKTINAYRWDSQIMNTLVSFNQEAKIQWTKREYGSIEEAATDVEYEYNKHSL